MRQRVLSISVIAGAIALAATYLWPDSIVTRNRDIDEGVYLMVARLIHRGYDIHTFFFDQFWLFPKILATAFKLVGDSLFAGRLIVFAFALAGLIGVAGLCYQLGAKWGAASAAILLGAISPLYLRQSRMVMSDVPATACIVLALVFLFAFQKSRRRFCLALTGVFASAAVIFKPFAIGFGITIIIVVIGNRLRREKGRLRFEWAGLAADISILVACGVIIAAPFIDFVHLANEYRRTVEFHFAERNWLTKRVDDRWRALVGFCRFNLPWIVCGVAGIVALRPLNFAMWALLAGELATAAILLQMPPWLHHYTLIIPPLIVFSILGFSRGITALKHAIIDLRNRRQPSSAGKLPAILFAFALLITAIDIPWVVRYNLRFRYSQPVHVDRIVGFLQQNFQPNEYLLSDDALVLYLADRLIPPSAINLIFADIFKFDHTSFTRLDESVRNDNVAGIIVSSRFERNPRLISWIKEKFPISARVGDDRPNEFTATVYRRGDEAR
jgi:4-amino-4-deoxy-L-arabinose transferase-like glycosyltransferase